MSQQTTELTEGGGFDRRSFLKRAAVVGAGTTWAAPTIQSMVAPAFAVGTPAGGCTACLTGGGAQIDGVTLNGSETVSVTFGLGPICCRGDGPVTIEVVAHRQTRPPTDRSWHFTRLDTLECTHTGSSAPPPGAADCPNRFAGTASDGHGNTLRFVFEDNGEPGTMVDLVFVDISGPRGTLTGQGLLSRGNLQAHQSLGPVRRDCSGC